MNDFKKEEPAERSMAEIANVLQAFTDAKKATIFCLNKAIENLDVSALVLASIMKALYHDETERNSIKDEITRFCKQFVELEKSKYKRTTVILASISIAATMLRELVLDLQKGNPEDNSEGKGATNNEGTTPNNPVA